MRSTNTLPKSSSLMGNRN